MGAEVVDPFALVSPAANDINLGVSSWVTEPPGVLHRLSPGTFIDGDVALHFTTRLVDGLRSRFIKTRRFHHVFDLTNAVGYSTHARQLITHWAIEAKQEIEQLTFIAPPSHAVLRMGVTTMMVTLRGASLQVEIHDAFSTAVRRLALRPF